LELLVRYIVLLKITGRKQYSVGVIDILRFLSYNVVEISFIPYGEKTTKYISFFTKLKPLRGYTFYNTLIMII
jgi:hypothetical protein